MTYSQRQEAQLQRFLEWKESEGGMEWPTHYRTLFQISQRARLSWLTTFSVGRVLEVGCNTGAVLSWVTADRPVPDPPHMGLDINPRNIELARVLAPELAFEVGDACHLPFGDESFDCVLVPETLEHLDFEAEVPQAVREALRVARSRVLITMPNGVIDTPEACSFKHRYLLDADHLEALRGLLPTCAVAWVGPFICILASKGALP